MSKLYNFIIIIILIIMLLFSSYNVIRINNNKNKCLIRIEEKENILLSIKNVFNESIYLSGLNLANIPLI